MTSEKDFVLSKKYNYYKGTYNRTERNQSPKGFKKCFILTKAALNV